MDVKLQTNDLISFAVLQTVAPNDLFVQMCVLLTSFQNVLKCNVNVNLNKTNLWSQLFTFSFNLCRYSLASLFVGKQKT
jgi:hypothetical protein